MIVEQVVMTPGDAEKLLIASLGTRQRTIRDDRVRKLAHAIRDGQWRLTHQPIAIDPDGHVIDGQHRLTAIASAGVDVPILIARDVDPATFGVMDTGASRSPADALKIAGHVSVNQLAAAARYLIAYEAVAGTTNSLHAMCRTFTTQDILNVADSERGATLVNALPAANAVAAAVTHPGFLTFIAPTIVLMKESPVDDGLCLEFWERVRDGASLPIGSPILVLRRFLTQDTGLISSKTNERAAIGIATILKAFNGWLANDTRSLVSFRVGVERMPEILPTVPGGPRYVPGDDEPGRRR
jgi:hypothetical protein